MYVLIIYILSNLFFPMFPVVPISEDVVSDFPYLGAEEVVEETVTLLAKLETDRQDTLAKLAAERDRVKSLGEKIDKLAEKRLLDLPAAVQKGNVLNVICNVTNLRSKISKDNEFFIAKFLSIFLLIHLPYCFRVNLHIPPFSSSFTHVYPLFIHLFFQIFFTS